MKTLLFLFYYSSVINNSVLYFFFNHFFKYIKSVNYEHDVDERFLSQPKDSAEKFDQFSQQIVSINTLISSKNTPPAATNKPTSIEMFVNPPPTTDSTNNKQNTILHTLKTNSNSLNELEARLRKSNEKEQTTSTSQPATTATPSSSTGASSSSEELLEMLKTLVKQQQLLLEQQTLRTQELQQPAPKPQVVEKAPLKPVEANVVSPKPTLVESKRLYSPPPAHEQEQDGVDASMLDNTANDLGETRYFVTEHIFDSHGAFIHLGTWQSKIKYQRIKIN